MSVILPTQVERERVSDASSPLGPYRNLLARLLRKEQPLGAHSLLVDQALEVWAKPGFETLICLPRLRFEPFDYQLQTAEMVLRRLRGRALLADEVGLGKTIEAGLVLAELRLRGLARRILILTPPGLVEQWREELERKFLLPSIVLTSTRPENGDREAISIASLAAARRPALSASLSADPWDLVIVDEAHRLKNPRSTSAGLVKRLITRYLLFLTATPVENRLDDLFQLVSLLSPGLLGSPKEFRMRHSVSSGNGEVRNLADLRTKLTEVMIRHRRSEVSLMLPSRIARTIRVRPSADEADLYRLVSERVRAEARHASSSRMLTLRTVQRIAGSTPATLAPTLERIGWGDLAQVAVEIAETEKTHLLMELIRRHGEAGEKVVVFTAFHETLNLLAGLARQQGVQAAIYHGSLSRIAKDSTTERLGY